MRVSMEQAGDQFEELLERAERGEPVIITRNGQDAAVLRAVEATDHRPELTLEERRAIIKEIMAKAPPPVPGEPLADRSHDFLYDENGLPV
ncbi:type II toxin-antitoxin system prevent-host-death family antitoxin [Rhizobium sp. AG855]|uniref:type II toxin-antitoxin system Phd/YefM family antitoxin n=1 Tax=Rhizobium sp. AG855 TaxID=2183898 RepID=UPI000E73D71D|nr:type II toxin-antitoxin system prevent-host-death family antitoxin [Rhizobium sp. AG855]RKE83701.1 prevent-host-death family protein [Rhizobium sp. AG855]